MICLENLYDRCAPNALIIVDDYVTWEGCARALHDFLSRRQLPCRIRDFRGVTYLLKVWLRSGSPRSANPPLVLTAAWSLTAGWSA